MDIIENIKTLLSKIIDKQNEESKYIIKRNNNN